jgi:hypothetical protein
MKALHNIQTPDVSLSNVSLPIQYIPPLLFSTRDAAALDIKNLRNFFPIQEQTKVGLPSSAQPRGEQNQQPQPGYKAACRELTAEPEFLNF